MADFDTPEEKAEKSTGGGRRKGGAERLERAWDEIQARTRKGLGWKPFDAQKAQGEADGQADKGVDNLRDRHAGHWAFIRQLG